MESLYRDSRKLCLETRSLLSELEAPAPDAPRAGAHGGDRNGRATAGGGSSGAVDESRVAANLATLQRNVTQLGSAVHSQPTAAKRATWQPRATQLSAELNDLSSTFARFRSQRQREQREHAEREALLASSQRRRRGGGGGGADDDGTCVVDLQQAESDSLGRSHAATDEILGSGAGALGALTRQRHALKGVRRKVLDMTNKLGVSQEWIRRIERREVADAKFVYGGLAALFTLVLVLWVLRRAHLV